MEVGGAQALRNPPFTPGTPKNFLGTPDNSGTQEKLMGTPGTPAGTPEIFLGTAGTPGTQGTPEKFLDTLSLR